MDDARQGANWGGSGVLVGIPSEANPSAVHLYAVSNDHVIHHCPIVRLVKASGDAFVLPGDGADWHPHPNGDDIAIRPLGAVATREFSFLGTEMLLSQDEVEREGIGPGDDCFMVGRYINQEFRQFDRPAARFGNIAMMPEPVYQRPRSFDQESFLVDMRSQAGFSGSPVLVYFEEPGWRRRIRPEGAPDPQDESIPLLERMAGRRVSGVMSSVWLLGIDWGHLPIWDDVYNDDLKVG